MTARAWEFPLAQSVERWTPLPEVPGSNLGGYVIKDGISNAVDAYASRPVASFDFEEVVLGNKFGQLEYIRTLLTCRKQKYESENNDVYFPRYVHHIIVYERHIYYFTREQHF